MKNAEGGQTYFVNVIAVIKGLDGDFDIIPYKPIEVKIPDQSLSAILFRKSIYFP
jgi:hypothetical protein